MNFLRRLSLTLAFSAPLIALAQISITMPPATQGWWLRNFSGAETGALVQTFVTPDASHTRLDRAEFRVARYTGASDFQAYVVQWDTTSSSLTGAPLWTSAIQSTVSSPAYPGYGVVSFDTGGIDLQPEQSYALVLYDPTPSSFGNYAIAGVNSSNPYPGGSAYWLWRGAASTSFNDVYSASVNTYGYSYDLAFGATFSAPGLTAVPEPAAAVAGLGLAFVAGLVVLRLRQRRRALAIAAAAHA